MPLPSPWHLLHLLAAPSVWVVVSPPWGEWGSGDLGDVWFFCAREMTSLRVCGGDHGGDVGVRAARYGHAPKWRLWVCTLSMSRVVSEGLVMLQPACAARDRLQKTEPTGRKVRSSGLRAASCDFGFRDWVADERVRGRRQQWQM